MTLYQLALILQFNDAVSFTVKDLAERTKLSVSDIQKMGTAFSELKLLQIHDESSVLTLNLDFTR